MPPTSCPGTAKLEAGTDGGAGREPVTLPHIAGEDLEVDPTGRIGPLSEAATHTDTPVP